MKILHVITSMDPKSGGPCQGIRNSHEELEKLGISKEIVCLDPPTAEYLKNETMKVPALGEGKTALAYHPALIPWLMENLERFDAVIVNGIWQWPSIAVWIATRKRKKKGLKSPPYFVMPHGMLDPWFQRDRSRWLKAIRNWIFWKVVQHKVIRDASALLFTCEEELRLARETFRPYEPKREINVGYGIPEPPPRTEDMGMAFREKSEHLPLDQPYFLFLSRIHPKKGVDLLIKAYVEVFVDKGGGPAKHAPALVIVGPLGSEYANQMIRLAASLIPGDVFTPESSKQSPGNECQTSVNRPTIHFTGMLQGDAKWGAFYGCEAFILPSHQENFGIAVVEALACGKPVLISDKVNIWREIETTRGGVVEVDSLEGTKNLFKTWSKIAGDVKTQFNSRDCYLVHFEIKRAANTFIQIFNGDMRHNP